MQHRFIGLLAVFVLTLATAPVHAEEAPAAENGAGDSVPVLEPPPSDQESIYREGAIFHTGFGGFALGNTTHVDGNDLGGGSYGGFVHIGYWVHDYFSLGIHALGIVGPRNVRTTPVGPNEDGAFSVIQYAIRSQVHLYEFSPEHELYLIVAPGLVQTGSLPKALDLAAPPATVDFQKNFGLTVGLGARLWRFNYVGTSFEAVFMQMFTGDDKFFAGGAMLTAWVRPRAGVIGGSEK